MSETKYFVPNISCMHCVHTIEMEVGEIPGVTKVKASEGTKEVWVEFEPPATSEKIVAMLNEINYAPA